MRIEKKYIRELKKQFGFYPTWLPGTPLKLGAIGVIKAGRINVIGNITDLGVEFDVLNDYDPIDLEYNHEGSATLSFKAAGSPAPTNSFLNDAHAGISVSFSKEKSFYFKANGTTSPMIKNQIELNKNILELYKNGQWDKNWVIVTEVINCTGCTILISTNASAQIDINAKADIGLDNLDIANAELGLKPAFNRGLSTNIIANSSITPLFRASKIKKRLFGAPVVKTRDLRSFETENLERMPIDAITPKIVSHQPNIVVLGDIDDDDLFED